MFCRVQRSYYKQSSFYFFGTKIETFTAIIVLYVIFIYFDEMFSILHNLFSDYCKDFLYQKVQIRIIKKISFQPTSQFFEIPKINDLISLAKQNINIISEHISTLSQVLAMVFSLTSALILGFSITWWIPILLLTTMTPLIYFRTKTENKTWNTRENYAPTFTQLDLYERILTSREFAKEVRLYNAQNEIIKKWQAQYTIFFSSINSIRINGTFKVGMWALVSGVGPFIAFFYVVYGAIHGFITLGKLSFLLGIIIQLRGSIACLLYNSSDIIKAPLKQNLWVD